MFVCGVQGKVEFHDRVEIMTGGGKHGALRLLPKDENRSDGRDLRCRQLSPMNSDRGDSDCTLPRGPFGFGMVAVDETFPKPLLLREEWRGGMPAPPNGVRTVSTSEEFVVMLFFRECSCCPSPCCPSHVMSRVGEGLLTTSASTRISTSFRDIDGYPLSQGQGSFAYV